MTGHTGMLSLESLDALRAVAHGDAYLKAGHGAQRAGRTRSLQALLRRELIESNPVGFGFALTNKGRELVTDETVTEKSP
jgi:hypothetical protein